MELFDSMPLARVPGFLRYAGFAVADENLWEMFLHGFAEDKTFAEFKAEHRAKLDREIAKAQPKDVREEVKKEAIDYSANFIQFVDD